MNNEITREQRALSWVIALSFLAVAVGFLIMALSSAGVLGYTPQPVSDPVEPDPWIVGNVTKDSHESSWGLTEYEDDYGDPQTLPGFVADTAAVNYSRIHGFQEYEIGGANWSDPNDWTEDTCTMSNPTVSQTQNGIAFYADPTATIQTCVWKLNIQPFDIRGDKDRLIAGIYFDDIGGLGQFSKLRIENDYSTPKEYRGSCGFDEVPGEGWGSLELVNKNRTVIFESEVINKIGYGTDKLNRIAEVMVVFTAGVDDLDPTRMEIYYLEVVAGIQRVGYSPEGEQVYRQTQSDNGSVKLGLFSPNFDYSNIDNLMVSYKQRASDLSEAYVEVSRTQYLSTYRFNYPQPEATSLHYEDVVLRDKLNQPGNVFSDVKLNGQDISHRYDPLSEGAEIVLLEGIQEGEQPTLYFETSYSSDEWDGITKGDGGWWDFGGGFITPQLVAPFVALGILVAILAVVLIQKFKKSREERPPSDAERGTESGTDRGVDVEVRVR